MFKNNNKKNLFLSFGDEGVQGIELEKDIGGFTYWFSKIHNYNATIDDYIGTDQYEYFRDVQLHRYTIKSGIIKEILKILTIYRYAKNIDLLYLIHTSPQSFIRAITYRIGGGKGKIYLKMDAEYSPTGKLMRWENIPPIKIFYLLLKPLPDIITIETKRAYEQMHLSCYRDLLGKKLFLMPNGFDDELLSEINISRIQIPEKEKIILTVGRIGSHQKNTELLLNILKDINLLDWKVYIVGPIEEGFNGKIDQFYMESPDLREKVFFTGMISKEEKYSLYNRARIFILTSRHESFAFVLAEAAYLNNYLISTDVGCIEDILENSNGKRIVSGDKSAFVNVFNELLLMDNKELNELISHNNSEKLTWKWILENNSGIQKLVSCDNHRTSSIRGTILSVFSPVLLVFIVMMVAGIYIAYDILHIYPKVISPTSWEK